jgi:hypothetical protein
VPVVVGIRALTTQFTSGRTSSNLGFREPHPPEGVLLSTGTLLGSRWSAGVVDPGVLGGVKAGEIKSGNSRSPWSEDKDERLRCDGTAEE